MISVNRYAFTHVYGYSRRDHRNNCLRFMSYVPIISIIAGIIMFSEQKKRVTNNIPQCYRAYQSRAIINLTGIAFVLIPVDLIATIMRCVGRSRNFRS